MAGDQRAVQNGVIIKHPSGGPTFRAEQSPRTQRSLFFARRNDAGGGLHGVRRVEINCGGPSHLRHRLTVGSENGTATRLGFRDWPAETFFPRRENQAACRAIKRREIFVGHIGEMPDVRRDPERSGERRVSRGKWFAYHNEQRRRRLRTAELCKDSEQSGAVFIPLPTANINIETAGALKLCVEQPDNPSVPMMIEALTRGYLAADRPRLAEEATDVWLKRNPPPGDRAYALYLRGRAIERQGKIPDALATYRESLALRPRSPECALALAEVLSREAPPEALPLYERLRDEGYKPTEVALGTARCLRGLGELDRAAGLVAPLETAQPSNVAVLVEAAKIALDKLRPADAERRLRAALAIAPKHRDANVQLARCLRDLGRDADARAQSEVVRRLDAELDGKAP